jgi:sulfur carrier protein
MHSTVRENHFGSGDNSVTNGAGPNMLIHLNGEPRELPGQITVAELLESAGYGLRRVAVEVNRGIVPKSRHATQRLQDGDKVEIVQAIGGG